MFDIPKFKVKLNIKRFLIAKIILLIVLGVLLYIGIYVNYWLIEKQVPMVWNWIIIIGILLLLIMEVLLSYIRYGNYYYVFYEKYFEIHSTKIHKIDYSDIQKITIKQNFYDRFFKTATLIIKSDKFYKIRNIDNYNQIHFFLQKVKNF